MAYRETARTRARAQQRRISIERAAREVIARDGFAAASISAVAGEAECSAGLIYTYYANRDELLRAVFARAAGHELTVIEAIVGRAGTAGQIADSIVDVFVRRAVAGRRLAHALLFEEVPDLVQLERLTLRRGYVAAVAGELDRVRADAAPRADKDTQPSTDEAVVGTVPAEVAARSIVGSIAENLVDFLDPAAPAPHADQVEALIDALSAFTRNALGEK